MEPEIENCRCVIVRLTALTSPVDMLSGSRTGCRSADVVADWRLDELPNVSGWSSENRRRLDHGDVR